MEKEKLNEELTGEVAGGRMINNPSRIKDPVVERTDICPTCHKPFKTKDFPWAPFGKKKCSECSKK